MQEIASERSVSGLLDTTQSKHSLINENSYEPVLYPRPFSILTKRLLFHLLCKTIDYKPSTFFSPRPQRIFSTNIAVISLFLFYKKEHNSFILDMAVLEPVKGTTVYLWKYVPSLIASIVFIGFYFLVGCLISWRMYKTKTWFSSWFVSGCFSKFPNTF